MLRRMKDLKGLAIGAKDGDIGEVNDFVFDDKNWTVRYLVADTSRWLPGRKVLISPIIVDQADWEGKRLPVLLTKEQVKNSPDINMDLYYRLNVFPIVIPPLRERREDIPLLVRYFAQKYARRMKKPIDTVPVKAMAALTEYYWPGNVRELENFIERAVILSRGTELQLPLAELKQRTKAPVTVSSNGLETLEHAEREHIVRALGESRWVIGGARGAAARLGMKRTTLQSRMRKLGIDRPS